MTVMRPPITPAGRRVRGWILLAAMLSPEPAKAQASVRVAEILEASGEVEIRRAAGAPWVTVRSGQELLGTDALRTRTRAFARVKFEAGLLWLLNAESVLQLGVAVSGDATTNTIRVRLDSGRAVATWTPDRTPVKAADGQAARSTPSAVVETPSGQASILGTEWSLNVDDSGRTALVVLEGTVELSNALASVTVRANEAAEMRVGQPPTLLRVVNPRDRVQWIADYSARPMRFADAQLGSARAAFDLSVADAAAGRNAAAIDRLESVTASGAPAAVLLALTDLLIDAGDLERARLHAESGRRQYSADARFDAMLSRIALFDDRTADSRTSADEATVKDPAAVEGWLALGESARRAGDGPSARRAFERASVVNPNDARGWFGLGSVEAEYEALGPARRSLVRALELDPAGPGYRGELGMLDTLANHLDAAEREFVQAMAERPGDYVTMTGRALLALKEGRDAEALDLLLRATLIEPKYARAQLYLGVAYYRLRRPDDAIRALTKASVLDPKDPMPYLMKSAIHTDFYQPAKALADARVARDLMPNLKSLNQLASTQKGTANLANAVAFMGMEQWAQHLAQQSYYPFWASSHLFLGDRYPSEYARTSEYYKGLLADPTVFGGSPLFQTLLPRAGGHIVGEVSIGDDADNTRSAGTTVSANGYANRVMPIGYATSIRGGIADAPPAIVSGRRAPAAASAAIGVTPNPQWSLFASGAVASERSNLRDPDSHDAITWRVVGRRLDAGANYRPSPRSSSALRIGVGRIESDMPMPPEVPILRIMSAPSEFQGRYTAVLSSGHQVSTGFDLASHREGVDARGEVDVTRSMHSGQLWVSARTASARAALQGDLFVNRERVELVDRSDGRPQPPQRLNGTRLLPRAGASLRIGSGVLRAAYQHQTRPWAAQSTLAVVATAGIPIDDQFLQPGGEQRRVRAQLDWEWSARTFTSVFADRRRFENNLSLNFVGRYQSLLRQIIGENRHTPADNVALALTGLRDIARDASRLNVAALSLLEGEPESGGGRVASTGMALNRILAPQLALSAQYVLSSSKDDASYGSGVPDSERDPLPYVARHVLSLGGTWVSPRRIYASGAAIYRSTRLTPSRFYTDGTLSSPIRQPDWSIRLGGSWETRDKRWALEVAAVDLLAKGAVASYQLTAKWRR